MTNPKQKIKERLDIPNGWKQEADWGEGEIPENIEYRQIGGRFVVTVANTSELLDNEWEVEGETMKIKESFIITIGIQPAPTNQYMADLTQYSMIHAFPVGTGTGENIINGEELEIAFNHFVSVADAMQSLMSLLEL